MNKFPDCFPDNFETEILPKEAKQENKSVYRIMKWGKINRDSFIGTFEEIQRGLRSRGKNFDPNDPGEYSTSCNMEYSEAKYVLDVLMRHPPAAIIAKGETEGTCGPSQLTSERNKSEKTQHVDWWVYKESEPQNYFKEVADE